MIDAVVLAGLVPVSLGACVGRCMVTYRHIDTDARQVGPGAISGTILGHVRNDSEFRRTIEGSRHGGGTEVKDNAATYTASGIAYCDGETPFGGCVAQHGACCMGWRRGRSNFGGQRLALASVTGAWRPGHWSTVPSSCRASIGWHPIRASLYFFSFKQCSAWPIGRMHKREGQAARLL